MLNKSKLGGAITYALNQRQPLMVFLDDPQVALTNNIAERSIKPTVLGRKNWFFSTSPAGARANARFLGLCQTAQVNGLSFRKYLIYLMKELPKLGPFPKMAALAAYLPWRREVQQACQPD